MHAKLLVGPLNEKRCYKKLFGLCKCIVSMAALNAILKNWDVPAKFQISAVSHP